MCGIAGVYSKNNSLTTKANKEKYTSGLRNKLLNSLTTSISHRGPDDYATYEDDVLSLGMRRLAIIDLTKNIYPFFSADKSIVIIFNGEIYNYKDLRHQLQRSGVKFSTDCDAEVILKGYEKWGMGVLKKLRGMFSISIWDKKKRKLYLVRDRIGIKPLYYINTSDFIMFSSEVKSFLRLDRKDFTPKLDPERLSILLGFMFYPISSETLFSNIYKVPPASYLEISESKIDTVTYWNLSNIEENTSLTLESAVNSLDQRLNKVVEMHLMSDVPVGILLSGGLDSSLITALAVKNNLGEGKINTFTAKFNHKLDESSNAKKVANHLNTFHTEVSINTDVFNKEIESYAYLLDDLGTFDGGMFTTNILCNEISKQGIKVLLLGEGADEVFGGYSWFGLGSSPFNKLPAILTNSIYYYALSRNIKYSMPKLISYWNNIQPNTANKFRDISLREIKSQLPNHLLMKVDKASMASSIEARVPYLDHKLVEFTYSLPSEFKLGKHSNYTKQVNEKLILREVAKKYLPAEVCSRKKRGFFLPMHDVLFSDIDKVKSYLLNINSIAIQLLGTKAIEHLFIPSRYNIVNMHNEYMLWRLYLLEIWAREYNLSI